MFLKVGILEFWIPLLFHDKISQTICVVVEMIHINTNQVGFVDALLGIHRTNLFVKLLAHISSNCPANFCLMQCAKLTHQGSNCVSISICQSYSYISVLRINI